jgi:hypothetical protein
MNMHDYFITELKNFANVFANHFKSIFITSHPTVAPSYFVTTYFLPPATVSATAVSWAVRRLIQSQSVCAYGIPSFIIKGCSDFSFHC